MKGVLRRTTLCHATTLCCAPYATAGEMLEPRPFYRLRKSVGNYQKARWE